MRALWTAASGMKAQQLGMDTVANNLANVSTTGFKKQKMEFKDLLYTAMRNVSNDVEQGEPVNLQIGHGVRPVATSRLFMDGNLERTENPTDVALQGPGFFVIQNPSGSPEAFYTRDGNFKFSAQEDSVTLVDSQGRSVLSLEGVEITIPNGMKDFTISEEGVVTAKNPQDNTTEEFGQIQIVQFINPEGLKAIGDNLFAETANSGAPVTEEEENKDTKLIQGYLETSNVQLVDEMVKMIITQRAYEINSKAVQTADDMLQTINTLKR